MCKGMKSNQVMSAGHADDVSPQSSPRHHVERPNAPTPEQTNHWLQDMDQVPEKRPETSMGQRSEQPVLASRSPSPDSQRLQSDEIHRPRSPTPNKMRAWEEELNDTGQGDSDHEDRGDQTDVNIHRLCTACQMNDVIKAFSLYERLSKMRVPLYEGVYKMLIECCMRTQQLGHAMHFYETLKSSGQRVSARLVTVLIEACAREQHSDKVHAIWNDWCPEGQPISASQSEVLLVVISALIRTMSPDLALDVLRDATQRSGGALASWLPDAEVELEELLQLNEMVAEEGRMNGTLMEELAGHFSELHMTLEELRERCLQDAEGRPGPPKGGHDDLLMEDLDLDLELAAM